MNIISSPPSFNVFPALAHLIRIKDRQRKTIILMSKKIPPPLQRLLSQGDSQGVLFLASPTRTDLLQDANHKSGMEVLHQGQSTLNILAVKSDGSSSKSELVNHKPVISSFLYSSRWFKQSAVSTFYNVASGMFSFLQITKFKGSITWRTLILRILFSLLILLLRSLVLTRKQTNSNLEETLSTNTIFPKLILRIMTSIKEKMCSNLTLQLSKLVIYLQYLD